MSEDVYLKLRAFLDTLGSGYPTTPTGVEIRILKKLFSPPEAELAMQLKSEPEEVPAIAARLGEEKKALGERLEEMAQKGLIYRIRKEGKPLYQAVQFIFLMRYLSSYPLTSSRTTTLLNTLIDHRYSIL